MEGKRDAVKNAEERADWEEGEVVEEGVGADEAAHELPDILKSQCPSSCTCKATNARSFENVCQTCARVCSRLICGHTF